MGSGQSAVHRLLTLPNGHSPVWGRFFTQEREIARGWRALPWAAMRSRTRPTLLGAGWAGAAALTLVAPGNLVMRLAFGKLGDPALVWQVLLAALGLLLALTTTCYGTRTAPRPHERRADGTIRPALWAKVVTWVAAGVPVLGFRFRTCCGGWAYRLV